MEKQIQILREIADEVEGEFRESYSGRGMFGSECCAVTSKGSSMEIIELAAERGIKGARFDNMGKGVVVYWPKISVKKNLTNS